MYRCGKIAKDICVVDGDDKNINCIYGFGCLLNIQKRSNYIFKIRHITQLKEDQLDIKCHLCNWTGKLGQKKQHDATHNN